MRIIGGIWRSRKLVMPRGPRTRPMPDRIREAVFGSLGEFFRVSGGLPPLRVADAFAGSGSMGLEALSRGAKDCRFFENDPATLAVLRANVKSFGLDPLACIERGDAWTRLAPAAAAASFDLVFLDPPYADAEDIRRGGPVRKLLGELHNVAQCRVLAILHHPVRLRFDPEADEGWQVVHRRVYGTTGITWFQK